MESKTQVYPLHAWRNNCVQLNVTQDEGGIKLCEFQLIDDNGIFDLTGYTNITYDGMKPNGNGCKINCTVINATKGLIEFNIVSGITDKVGLVRGCIDILNANGSIKFDGVNIKVSCNTANNSAIKSQEFTALEEALNKVTTLTPEGTAILGDDSVTTSKIADGTVTSAKIVKGAVKSANLEDGAVVMSKLANNAVGTEKIADGNITLAKLAQAVVDLINSKASQTEVLSNENFAVKSLNIADGAIISKKIDNGAIDITKISESVRLMLLKTNVLQDLYVDEYIAQYGSTSTGINACIQQAIITGKNIIFSSKVYSLDSALCIDNTGATTKALHIEFNNATLKYVGASGIDGIITGNIGSNNGTVVHIFNNLNLDAGINCQYGINFDKAIRLRINNIKVKNGINGAINISAGIENYIDNFSLWRTESANTINIETTGLRVKSTDSCYSNGVIVNYKTAFEGAGANTFSEIHPWFYFNDDEPNNKLVMTQSIGCVVDGMTILSNIEFDSCTKGIQINEDKTTVTITNPMIVTPSMYYVAEAPIPILINLANGICGSNISVSGVNLSQYYAKQMYFCNLSSNKINYDMSEKGMLNIPIESPSMTVCGTVTGEDIAVTATKIKVKNNPTFVIISGRNVMPCEQKQYTGNGIIVYVYDDFRIQLSGVATANTNFYIAGSWNNTQPIMIFKKNVRYCIMTPNIEGVSFGFLNKQNEVIHVEGNRGTPYLQVIYGADVEITGIFIKISVDADFTQMTGGKLFLYPAIYRGGKPEQYVKTTSQVVTDYTLETACDGETYITTKSGEVASVEYKNGDIVSLSEFELLKTRVAALENT